MNQITFSRLNQIYNDIILIDGMPGSGKIIINDFISCNNNIEILKFSSELENITILKFFDKISEDAFDTYLKIYFDNLLYNMMMSRNINFRPSDQSSAFKSRNFIKYFKRLFNKGNEKVPSLIKQKKPSLRFMTHSILGESKCLFNLLKDKLKIIEVVRNPYYLVESNINYLNNLNNFDGRYFDLTINKENSNLPYWAYEIKNEYKKMSLADNIIYLLIYKYNLIKNFKIKNKKLSKNQCIKIPFESFTANPNYFIDNLKNKFNINLKIPKSIYKKYKIPRLNNFDENEKLKIINNLKKYNITDKYLNELEILYNNYVNENLIG